MPSPLIGLLALPLIVAQLPALRPVRDGRWSEPTTWDAGRIPGEGDRVFIPAARSVQFDAAATPPIRTVHIAGRLWFARDRDTCLSAALIKVGPGEDCDDSVLACEEHLPELAGDQLRGVLEVGSWGRPIPAGTTARIRLVPAAGADPDHLPALIACGGRIELHGALLSRTWAKLGAKAGQGDTEIRLAEAVEGWNVGDRLVVTSTRKQVVRDEGETPPLIGNSETEERTIAGIEGAVIRLDTALKHDHRGEGDYRAEVANLSRNVVIESADPGVARGHTMFHRGSAASISYAEFRHLGKAGKLGRYSLHFHKAGDTMRGSAVLGASIWDSDNRWITIHGTNQLLVRDCVGYRSRGHGFFLEDGTEVENWLDGNLAIQAADTDPLPDQILKYDPNDGAGFWWANSGNAFTRNLAVDCGEYGFRYDAPARADFDPVLPIRGADGQIRPTDVRTMPLLRFADNEAHTQRRYGANLGGGHGSGAEGGVGGVGPGDDQPSIVRGLRIWESHWAVTPAAPGFLFESPRIGYCDFGFWRPRYDRQGYRDLGFYRTRWSAAMEQGQRPDRTDPFDAIKDDRPPITLILGATRLADGRIRVRGAAIDNGAVAGVEVNGRPAQSLSPGFEDWSVDLDLPAGRAVLRAAARDRAGNQERVPHAVTWLIADGEDDVRPFP